MESFAIKLYAQIKHRVTKRKAKAHLYLGLELMPIEDFLLWAAASNLSELYKAWVEAGRPRKLVPTVDRIDSTKGYVLGNIRWVTLSDNSKNVVHQRKRTRLGGRGVHLTKTGKWEARAHINYKHKYIGRFDSEAEAREAYETYLEDSYGGNQDRHRQSET